MLCKICGMTQQKDLAVAASCGFDFCGFVFHEQSPRYIKPKDAAPLTSGAMKRVGVFVEHTAEQIMEIMATARLHYAQLHGKQSCAAAKSIGSERVIRVFWPANYANVNALQTEAEQYADSCAYFLLDAGMRGGGSGQKLDWRQFASLQLPRPWFLAGGLDEDNMAIALAQCNPAGLDFNSGLEVSPGVKTHQKIIAVSDKLRGL